MTALALAESRCANCTCPSERQQLLTSGAIEAARHLMAWYLVEERTLPEHLRTLATAETVEAMQTLRDALAAERAARHG